MAAGSGVHSFATFLRGDVHLAKPKSFYHRSAKSMSATQNVTDIATSDTRTFCKETRRHQEEFMTTNIKINHGKSGTPFAMRAIRGLWRLAVDRPYRNMMWLYWARPNGAFQPFNDTQHDRYPFIFDFVQTQLGTDRNLNILSYGCSTGDEVFSLRQYFPHATIKGLDINRANVAVCRRRLRAVPDTGIAFETAASTQAEPSSAYDAIFAWPCCAMAVSGCPASPDATI